MGRAVDLLCVTDVAEALESLRALIPVPVLVVHTKYWSAAVGDRAAAYTEALDEGIVVASTRYTHGDDYTDDDYNRMRNRPRHTEAARFAGNLEERMRGVVRCLPGYHLDVAEPTTIGLGDAFVGGFLAAVERHGVD